MSSISSDPLFIGLTRQPLILGVSLHYALFNMIACTVLFIQSSSIKVFLFGLVIHGVGYYLCFKEPRFMQLYMKKYEKCGVCPNKIFHGGNSYGV